MSFGFGYYNVARFVSAFSLPRFRLFSTCPSLFFVTFCQRILTASMSVWLCVFVCCVLLALNHTSWVAKFFSEHSVRLLCKWTAKKNEGKIKKVPPYCTSLYLAMMALNDHLYPRSGFFFHFSFFFGKFQSPPFIVLAVVVKAFTSRR